MTRANDRVRLLFFLLHFPRLSFRLYNLARDLRNSSRTERERETSTTTVTTGNYLERCSRLPFFRDRELDPRIPLETSRRLRRSLRRLLKEASAQIALSFSLSLLFLLLLLRRAVESWLGGNKTRDAMRDLNSFPGIADARVSELRSSFKFFDRHAARKPTHNRPPPFTEAVPRN